MENAADGEQSCPPLVFRLHDLPSHRRQAHIPPTYDGVALMKTQGAGKDVVFLSGVRTGFGSFGGSLKDLSAIDLGVADRKSTRLNSSHSQISYAVFCLKKKKKILSL